MDFSHAITYAVFQMMVSLFMASPFAKMTAEHDFISIQPKQMVRLLEQPKTAGIRYYFTLTPSGKISAVVMALDSAAQENRSIILNAKNRAEAERGIKAYAEKKMVDHTGIIFGTIGVGSQNGALMYTQGKDELLQLARTSKEIRAFYAMKEDPATKKQHVVLCFAAADGTGTVLQKNASATTATPTILDFSGDCPPGCRYP